MTNRSAFASISAFVVCLVVAIGEPRPAFASFHFMQIEQVIGGVEGDTTAQAIQLRMRSGGQQFVTPARIRVWDAAGQNPILVVDFNQSVSNGSSGRRILIASANLAVHTAPSATPDFTMANLIPASYLAAGSLTFETDAGTTIYWRLSWGGASYTGSTTGSIFNDLDGDFGPPFPGPLPSSDLRALQFQQSFSAQSTTNEADYTLTGGAAVFNKNSGTAFALGSFGACCDRTDNICEESVLEANCQEALQEWTEGAICDSLDPPCAALGACCDPITGTCAQRTQADCEADRSRFGGDGSECTDFEPPCTVPISIGLEVVAGGSAVAAAAETLTAPLMVTHAGDGSGRLFIVDQIGQIRIVDASGNLLPTPFLDISSKIVSVGIDFTAFGLGVFDERGLLGLAFHPGYAGNGKFYVRYSAPRSSTGDEPCDPVNFPFTTISGDAVGCHKAILAEYTVSGDPDVADPTSERILFSADEPQFNHNSGHVAFGPDGLLYWTLGDGGGANDGLADVPPSHGPKGNAQNIETRLGNILRIDVDSTPDTGLQYHVPTGNPFAASCPSGFPSCVPEIYAYGFRNPYRFSFGAVNAQDSLIVGDVGQNLFEEISIVPVEATPATLNYGWVIREGFSCFDPLDPVNPPATCATTGPLGEDLLDPVLDYGHSVGIAVIGGFIYQGSYPPLQGKYVFGDFSQDFGPTGRLFYMDVEGPEAFELREFFLAPDGLPLGQAMFGLGEGEDGEMYVCASDNIGPVGNVGVVYRIVAPTPGDSTLSSRYVSINPPPSPTPFALAVTADCSLAEVKYAGTPFEVVSGSGPEQIALLVDDPNKAARLTSSGWGGTVHVTGLEIVPLTDFKIQIDFGTVGTPVLSGAALATTNKRGDMVEPFGSNSQPNFSDIGASVDKFKDLLTAPPMHRADLAGFGMTPCMPDQTASFSDIGDAVDGWKRIVLDCSSPCP